MEIEILGCSSFIPIHLKRSTCLFNKIQPAISLRNSKSDLITLLFPGFYYKKLPYRI